MRNSVYVNGKEYQSVNSVVSRIHYLKDRVNLRPEQVEELEYLNYALSTVISTPILSVKPFHEWRYPGYRSRRETDLSEWGFAITKIGKRFAVVAMVSGEIHYRVNIYKNLNEAKLSFESLNSFLESAKECPQTKAAFMLAQP